MVCRWEVGLEMSKCLDYCLLCYHTLGFDGDPTAIRTLGGVWERAYPRQAVTDAL